MFQIIISKCSFKRIVFVYTPVFAFIGILHILRLSAVGEQIFQQNEWLHWFTDLKNDIKFLTNI